MNGFQNQLAFVHGEDAQRGDNVGYVAPRGDEIHLSGEGALIVLGAPDDRAPCRRNEHRAARAAWKTNLRLVVIADDRGIDMTARIELHAAEKCDIQPAAHAQIENLHQRELCAGAFPQLAARAGVFPQGRFDGIDAAGNVQMHGVRRVRLFCQQRGDHGHMGGYAMEYRVAVADQSGHRDDHHVAGSDHGSFLP